MNDDFDDILDGKPTPITYRQWIIIESMIDRTSLTREYKSEVLQKLNSYTEIEAEKIVTKIFENEIKTDPQDQWKKMRKDGVFNS